MKVCEVSITVVCPEADADTVAFELDEWFYGSGVGMTRPEGPFVSDPRDPTEQEADSLDIELEALAEEAAGREEA